MKVNFSALLRKNLKGEREVKALLHTSLIIFDGIFLVIRSNLHLGYCIWKQWLYTTNLQPKLEHLNIPSKDSSISTQNIHGLKFEPYFATDRSMKSWIDITLHYTIPLVSADTILEDEDFLTQWAWALIQPPQLPGRWCGCHKALQLS